MVFYRLYLDNQKLLLSPKRPRRSLAGNDEKEVGWFGVVTMRMDKSGQAMLMRRMGGMGRPTKGVGRAGDDDEDGQGGQR